MKIKNFKITFEVPEPKLATIVALLATEVSGLTVQETGVPSITRRASDKAPPSRKGGGFAMKAAVALLGNKSIGDVLAYSALEAALTDHGLSASTVNPLLTDLCRMGVVERGSGKTFKVLKAIPAGAK